MTIKYKSIKEIKNMISHKEISNKEVIQEVFSLINQFQELNAFITLNEENSIKKAEELDNNPSDLPLAGIPIAQKDLFCTKGFKTTCGSKMLESFNPPYSSKFEEALDAYKLLLEKSGSLGILLSYKNDPDKKADNSRNGDLTAETYNVDQMVDCDDEFLNRGLENKVKATFDKPFSLLKSIHMLSLIHI